MSNISSATSSTTSSFITSLVINFAVFGVELVAFTLIRPRFKVVYSPRTYVPIESKRAEPMDSRFWMWPLDVFKFDYDDIRRQNGLDAYVFVRFLRMMVKILFPIWIVSWIILLPVDAVRGAGGHGLDMFTFGNVAKSRQPRYAAHIILVWLSTFYIFWIVKGEMRHYITVRQRHLVDPRHASSAQASTVLITGVPPRMLQPSVIRKTFDIMPGGVRRVWVNHDLKDIPDLFNERLAAINKLESAVTSLMSMAAKYELKRAKALAKGKKPKPIVKLEEYDTEESKLTIANKLVPKKDRPSHRLKAVSWLPFALPFMGKKVDTIDWCMEEIPRLTEEIENRKAVYERESASETTTTTHTGEKKEGADEEVYPRQNSIFVQFNEQIAAHLAVQALNHHEPYRMGNRYADVAPEDIIWGNLNLNPYEMKIRQAGSYALTAGLIILWAFPVAFVGFVSNVKGLSTSVAWLHWLSKLGPVVIGIISGVLPPVLLAVLMMLLPIILRLLARFEGIPRYTRLELSLMTRFFIFQVIHSFLIVTLSSGIIKALGPLFHDPSSAATLLAQNLPAASTFFLTYILLQLSTVGMGFLQIIPLIIYYVKLFLLGSTPRSVYGIKNTLRSVQWGTLFPMITLLVVITLAYSIISPIINGLACFIFFLLFHLYKYLFLYQFDQPPASDTGGLFFPKAITHLFVGLYIEQICLCALFFLAQDEQSHQSAIPEGAIMIVLIVITAGFHIVLNDSYGPLLRALPLSLVEQARAERGPIEDSRSEKVNGSSASVHSTALEKPGSGAVQRNGKHGRILDEEEGYELAEASPKGSPGEEFAPGASTSDVGTTNGKAPAAALQQRRGRGASKVTNGVDFMHPALGEARIVWIPRDTHGISQEEQEAIASRGIDISSEHAVMSEKGTVDVSSYPPGEPPTESV